MECGLYCQICCNRFEEVLHFKKHMTSHKHKQMLKDVFQKERINCSYRIPYVVFMGPKRKKFDFQGSAVGLSLITLCFSQIPDLSFYLCHVCKDKYSMDTILTHTFSQSHCFHYFVYTNPDYLSFSWKPDMDMATFLGWKLKRESRKSELQTLRLLHLPPVLIKKLMSSTFSEVMQTLCENDKLLKRFEAMHQNRVTLQDYHRNHNRQHPLLGLQHIVECVSFEPEQKSYLCTLCQLVIPSHTIIGHLLSFDHVDLYFKAWHPSTVTSNESDSNSFLLDCAKQAEKIHAAENVSVQQVKLQPDVFKSVNFDSYLEALKSLESITKRCLTISIKPGDKIDHHPATAPSTKEVRCLIHCQNCCERFSNMFRYLEHLTNDKHIRMMQELSQDWTGHFYDRGKFYVDLYTYINESLKKNMPPVGTSLVMTCLTSVSKDDPFYLCVACQEYFCQSDIRNHFESRKHLISTQLYQNPWLLPFAWDGDLDIRALRWTAWKEDQNRGRIFLKIFDVPYSVFHCLDSHYQQVFHRLQVQYCGFMHKVPQSKTYRKNKQNEQFPLLEQLGCDNELLVKGISDVCNPRKTRVMYFPGDTVSDLTNKLLSLTTDQPDIETLVVHVGANDLAKQKSEILKKDFNILLDTMGKLRMKLFLSGPIPSPQWGDEKHSRLLTINKWLIKACSTSSVTFIDNLWIYWQRFHLFGRGGRNLNKHGIKLLTANLFYFINKDSNRIIASEEQAQGCLTRMERSPDQEHNIPKQADKSTGDGATASLAPSPLPLCSSKHSQDSMDTNEEMSSGPEFLKFTDGMNQQVRLGTSLLSTHVADITTFKQPAPDLPEDPSLCVSEV